MKVLLVDDHVLFRQGMQLMLERLAPSIETFEAGDLPSALVMAQTQSDLDMVFFDLGLPGVSGMDALVAFKQAHDGLPVVVLSALSDKQTVLDALYHGAIGFIPKSASMLALEGALKAVVSNRIYLPATALDVPDASVLRDSSTYKKLAELPLTDRQKEVFKLILLGKSNKVIARDLGVAESTIKSHVKPILQALNVTSRVQAIVEMGRLGVELD
ncbi:MAG: response regulator transcription factor [Rhizobacter sp.]